MYLIVNKKYIVLDLTQNVYIIRLESFLTYLHILFTFNTDYKHRFGQF